MEAAILEVRENEVENEAAQASSAVGLDCEGANGAIVAFDQFNPAVDSTPTRVAGRTLWREIRVKVVPAVVFLLTVAGIVYFWPPF